jgi:hypothetical protein
MYSAAAIDRCTNAVRGAQLGGDKGGRVRALAWSDRPCRDFGIRSEVNSVHRMMVATKNGPNSIWLADPFGCLERNAPSRQRLAERPPQIELRPGTLSAAPSSIDAWYGRGMTLVTTRAGGVCSQGVAGERQSTRVLARHS